MTGEQDIAGVLQERRRKRRKRRRRRNDDISRSKSVKNQLPSITLSIDATNLFTVTSLWSYCECFIHTINLKKNYIFNCKLLTNNFRTLAWLLWKLNWPNLTLLFFIISPCVSVLWRRKVNSVLLILKISTNYACVNIVPNFCSWIILNEC